MFGLLSWLFLLSKIMDDLFFFLAFYFNESKILISSVYQNLGFYFYLVVLYRELKKRRLHDMSNRLGFFHSFTSLTFVIPIICLIREFAK